MGIFAVMAGDFRPFRSLARRIGSPETGSNARIPPVSGNLSRRTRKRAERRNGWLTWEDSNFHITIPKNAFEMSTEFPLIWPEIRLGDFCSCELCSEQTHQRVRRNASLGRSTSVLRCHM